MAVLSVSRVELENNNLMRLVMESNNYHNPVSEQYYWTTDETSAMICMLAGIGRILGHNDIDNL